MSNNSQVKPADFHKQCITIVSKYVECHDPLVFDLIDRVNGVYAIRNTNTLITIDGDPLFYLLKVKNSKGLYMHVSVTWEAPYNNASLDQNHRFEGISVQFLQGTGNVFCRAEWDVKKKEKLEHPQPHWHWGYVKTQNEKQGFTVPGDGVEAKKAFVEETREEESSLPSVDFKELHYAMASKWVSHDSAVEDFNPQRLYNWLKNCVGNVIDQYNYQVNKKSFESSRL